MEKSPINKTTILASVLFALLILGIVFVAYFISRNANILVFCNVGQGDGAYIRLENKIDILIDAGPDNKILTCLGKHMPFFDKKIELAFMTHPQLDHYGGFSSMLDHYTIGYFVVSGIGSKNQSFQDLWTKLNQKGVVVKKVSAGEKIKVGQGEIDFLWPSRDFLTHNSYKNTTDVNNNQQTSDLASTSLDPNDFSEVFMLSEKRLKVLFTGDIDEQLYQRLSQQPVPNVDILKVAHHGSKTGISSQFLKLADPQVSVISVGAHNRYGHPSPATLDILKALKTKIRRTDQEGDIVFRF